MEIVWPPDSPAQRLKYTYTAYREKPLNHWSLEEAHEFLKLIAPVLQDYGWLVGLYGSTLIKGVGRDLDLMCINWRPASIPDLQWVFPGAKIGDAHHGALGGVSMVVMLSIGRLVDIQFRYSDLVKT